MWIDRLLRGAYAKTMQGNGEPAQQGGKMNIQIQNTQPVELADLMASFAATADEFKRYATRHEPAILPRDIKIYVIELRSGSIIADLVAMAPVILPQLMDAGRVTLDYLRFLAECYKYLKGEAPRPTEELEKQDWQNLSNIVEPITKDSGAIMQISGSLTVNGPVETIVLMNSMEANATQNNANREIRALSEGVTGLYQNVVLDLLQTRNAPARPVVGDRGRIESISPEIVKVMFDNDTVKFEIVKDAANPYRFAYVVDVAVETIQGRPALYRVLSIRDRIEKPPALS